MYLSTFSQILLQYVLLKCGRINFGVSISNITPNLHEFEIQLCEMPKKGLILRIAGQNITRRMDIGNMYNLYLKNFSI
jgi:hypothetical protein